ncbi:hypothetical protein FQR65_LT10873 [Abscondita terminalis]|nr:hypothetical protein FQR65_LT10873 [Abscondita terminalis]
MKRNTTALTILFNIINLCKGEFTINSSCTLLKDNLAASISSFTSCAVSYSRPILFCEKCVNIFIGLENDYKNLSVSKDEDGPCIDDYVHLDKLEIVQTLYDNSLNLWNNAKCYECFANVNGSLTNTSSEETIKFNNIFTNLTVCLNRTDVNSSNVCSACFDDYNKLDKYYRSITDENEKIGVCMDIVDVMNGTRLYWSSNCCKFRHKDETIFIISTILVTSATLLFYLLTKLCSHKNTPVLLKQTRFAGSFSRVVD